jgi:hypothetical protein
MTSETNDRRDDVSLQAVMAEISGLEVAMNELLQSADKGIGAAGALIVSGIGLALTERAPVVLIALPYGITAAFFFMLQKYIERQMRAGIKRKLEEEVNCRLDQAVFHQAMVLRQVKRPDELAGFVVYGVSAAAIIAFSFVSIAEYQPPQFLRWLEDVWWAHIIGLVLCLSVVLIAWFRMNSAEDEAYTKAKASRLEQAMEHNVVQD